ncbi:MAG: (2E,6E)-farnesyl diphosphate synthase [Gammaproteobacteria bacterium]|nr:(2E,6E)-farnesyl diphosphate synthase [Gammaproteobacteria bacterium]
MATNHLLADFMHFCQQRVTHALNKVLPDADTSPSRLHAAMRYATLNGGKRIRPILVYASGEAAEVTNENLDAAACAVELIHAYSLVHDDLPAMDDDDLRRNQPTCHKAYDEATAILVGDALQTLALQVLCTGNHLDVPAETRLNMLETLTRAAGSRGMVGGQAMDLAAVGQTLNLTELENLHIHKTGALIRASVKLGTLLNPQLEKTRRQALDHYAKCIGLAFQIQDDILDIEGSTQTLGKTQGKDRQQNKPTYPSLLGLNGAKEKAEELRQAAQDSLTQFDSKADPLRWIADYITLRSY